MLRALSSPDLWSEVSHGYASDSVGEHAEDTFAIADHVKRQRIRRTRCHEAPRDRIPQETGRRLERYSQLQSRPPAHNPTDHIQAYEVECFLSQNTLRQIVELVEGPNHSPRENSSGPLGANSTQHRLSEFPGDTGMR